MARHTEVQNIANNQMRRCSRDREKVKVITRGDLESYELAPEKSAEIIVSMETSQSHEHGIKLEVSRNTEGLNVKRQELQCNSRSLLKVVSENSSAFI